LNRQILGLHSRLHYHLQSLVQTRLYPVPDLEFWNPLDWQALEVALLLLEFVGLIPQAY